MIHEGQVITIEDLPRGLNKVFVERWAIMKGKPLKVNSRMGCRWNKPKQGYLKINCDAATNHNHSVLSIVARDWRGNLVFAHSKKAYTNISVQAEAETIRWAIWVAAQCYFQHFVVESDSMICIDTINKVGSNPP